MRCAAGDEPVVVFGRASADQASILLSHCHSALIAAGMSPNLFGTDEDAESGEVSSM